MAAKRPRLRSLRCPTCRKVVLRSDLEFPFCSNRCRRIDLGKWASGAYVISSPTFDPDAGAVGAQENAPSEGSGEAEKDRINHPDGKLR